MDGAKAGGTRADSVYAGLRRAIIEQALAPGDKLPEDAIGRSFGVSRTLVRGALARLEAEGLVRLQANRGAEVASPTLEEAADIFEIRRCLELEAVGRLAGRATEADIARLEAHLEEEEAAVDGDAARSIRLTGEFHILLAALAGSTVLLGYGGKGGVRGRGHGGVRGAGAPGLDRGVAAARQAGGIGLDGVTSRRCRGTGAVDGNRNQTALDRGDPGTLRRVARDVERR